MGIYINELMYIELYTTNNSTYLSDLHFCDTYKKLYILLHEIAINSFTHDDCSYAFEFCDEFTKHYKLQNEENIPIPNNFKKKLIYFLKNIEKYKFFYYEKPSDWNDYFLETKGIIILNDQIPKYIIDENYFMQKDKWWNKFPKIINEIKNKFNIQN